MTILLDTGFVFAFLNQQDESHREAVALVARIARREWGTPIITEFVIAELLSLIRARTGSAVVEQAARAFLPLPTSTLRGLMLAPIGGALLGKTWETFEKYRDQKVSFTDASLLVAMREMRAERIATFDRVLANLAAAAA